MIHAFVINSLGDRPGMAAVGVHHPDCRRIARCGPAEDDLLAVRRLARAEIPAVFLRWRQVGDAAIADFHAAEADASLGHFRLKLAVEMVEVRLADAVLPGDFGTGNSAGKEDSAVV